MSAAPTTPESTEPSTRHSLGAAHGSAGWVTRGARIDASYLDRETVCPLEVAQSDPCYGLSGCNEWKASVLREAAEKWKSGASLLETKADELDPPNAMNET